MQRSTSRGSNRFKVCLQLPVASISVDVDLLDPTLPLFAANVRKVPAAVDGDFARRHADDVESSTRCLQMESPLSFSVLRVWLASAFSSATALFEVAETGSLQECDARTI